MKLLVGLGNPEARYLLTRHNIGFMVIDQLAIYFKGDSFKQKFNGLISKIVINNNTYMLLKPTTYMNRSGECMRKIMDFYKINIENI